MNPLYAVAHAVETLESLAPADDLERNISSLALTTVTYAAVALFFLVFIAAIVNKRFPRLKLPVFIMMATAMLGSVIVLLSSTVYLNMKSESGGPIHWHADFEIWACGNQLELRDPTGTFSNKIGTPVLHEHNDERIHLEGVVVDKSHDASLGKFFDVVGGAIDGDSLVVPLNDETGLWLEDHVDRDISLNNTALLTGFISDHGEDGVLAEFENGQKCGDTTSEVQVFVYHFDEADQVYWQEKIAEPSSYAIYENPNVPPGDCVIVEFEPGKERTDRLCQQFGIRDAELCDEFGVEADKRSICKTREVGGVTEEGEIIELEDLHEFTPDELQPLENIEGDG